MLRVGSGRGRRGLMNAPELVTNGTFTADLSGWVAAHTAPSTVNWVGGQAVWTTDGAALGRLRQSVPTEIGLTYAVSKSGTASYNVGTSAGNSSLLGDSTDTTPRTFTATTTTTWINTFSSVNGATLDNVSMKRA